MTTTAPIHCSATTCVMPEDLYPSRRDALPQWLQRSDPTVWGKPAGGFSTAERREVEDRGFLALPGFFEPGRVEVLSRVAARLRRLDDGDHGPEIIIEPGSRAVRSVFDVHRSSPVIDRLVRDPRLLARVSEILGGEVYVHQSRINYKPAFRGKDFYWHSDFETWHVEDGMPRMRALSCVVNLTENTPHNGPLMVIPGSHRTFISCVGATPQDHHLSSLKDQKYGVPDEGSLERLARDHGIEAPTGPAGSVLLFDCNLMHGSSSNITPFARTNVFIVYNSVENRLLPPFGAPRPRPDFLANRTDQEPLVPVEDPDSC